MRVLDFFKPGGQIGSKRNRRRNRAVDDGLRIGDLRLSGTHLTQSAKIMWL